MRIAGLFTFGFLALATAAPQGFSPDAEFLPGMMGGGGMGRGVPGGFDGPGMGFPGDGRRVLVVTLRRAEPPRSFLDDFLSSFGFSRRPSFFGSPGGFPDFGVDDSPFFGPADIPFPAGGDVPSPPAEDESSFSLFPSLPPLDPADLPDNYSNSTHEVKVVNGSRVEMNHTITKNTNDDGVLFTRVHVIRLGPHDEAATQAGEGEGVAPEVTGESLSVPQEDPSVNQVVTELYEDFGSRQHRRHRRFVPFGLLPLLINPPTWARRWLGEVPQQEPEKVELKLHSHTYTGDTDVNYLSHPLHEDPDAEVFNSVEEHVGVKEEELRWVEEKKGALRGEELIIQHRSRETWPSL